MSKALMKPRQARKIAQAAGRRGALGGGANVLPVPVATKAGDSRSILLPDARESADTFIFEIDNASTTTAYDVVLFDHFGFITDNLGYTQNANITITGVTASYAAAVKALAANPIQVVGLNYKADDEAFQTIKFRRIDLNGSENTQVVNPLTSERNTQFQGDLLTVRFNQVIDGNTAMIVRIPADQTARFTLFLGATFNRLT